MRCVALRWPEMSWMLTGWMFLLCAWTGLSASAAQAEEAASFKEMVQKGKAKVSLRYRYETVEDPLFGDDGQASTLRTTLSLQSATYRGWSAFLEAENVLDIGLDDEHNNLGAGSLNNGVRDRPAIADPEITEVNQAYIRYESGTFHLNLGRQAINLGDQRFVGAVGWRQNHQTFDAARLGFKVGQTEITYAFLENVNRIFGDNLAMASHLLNVGWSGSAGKLTLYGYLLDYDRLPLLSTSTYGAEFAGKAGKNVKFHYEAEYAKQSDAGDNPRDVDAGYYHGMVGIGSAAFTGKVGLEVLEGDPNDGRFLTPLATLHKFNGWADIFLNTPSTGLEDRYLQILGKAGAVSWTAIYHDFTSNTGNFGYGTEIDAQLVYTTRWNQAFGLKGAFYDADTLARDIDKIWLWTSYTF